MSKKYDIQELKRLERIGVLLDELGSDAHIVMRRTPEEVQFKWPKKKSLKKN